MNITRRNVIPPECANFQLGSHKSTILPLPFRLYSSPTSISLLQPSLHSSILPFTCVFLPLFLLESHKRISSTQSFSSNHLLQLHFSHPNFFFIFHTSPPSPCISATFSSLGSHKSIIVTSPPSFSSSNCLLHFNLSLPNVFFIFHRIE